MINERSIKIEIHLTKDQQIKCHQIFGTLRFLWNQYIEYNMNYYNDTKKFMWYHEFSIYMTHTLCNLYPWIKDTPGAARQHILKDASKALSYYINHKKSGNQNNGFIKFKSKREPIQSYWFPKSAKSSKIRFKDNDLSHIWIYTLHWIKLKQSDYLTEDMLPYITSGRITYKRSTNRWYVVFIIQGYDDPKVKKYIDSNNQSSPIGIDLGIKDYATICSINQDKYSCIHLPPFIKSKNYIEYESKICKLQWKISHKELTNLHSLGYEVCPKNLSREKRRFIYDTKNIQKLWKKVAKLKEHQQFIAEDYIKQLCVYLVRTKPEYIAIEDLHTLEMLISGSHSLSDHIAKSKFRYFRDFLIHKCKEYEIELRLIDSYYPSSRICSHCGNKKRNLTLSERTYVCRKCGHVVDRDENASINILNCTRYTLGYEGE